MRIYKEDGSISVLVAVSIIFLIATISAAFLVSGVNREYQLRRQIAVKDVYQEQMDDYANIYCDIAGLGTYDKEQKVNIPIFPDDVEDPTNNMFYPAIYRPGAIDPVEDAQRANITVVNDNNVAVNWFNYQNKEWATAVEVIKVEDSDLEIKKTWVWIPRFAVKLSNDSGAPFSVVFLIGDTDRYLSTDAEGKPTIKQIGTEYYIPQAFQQLNSKRGFWVEKKGFKTTKKIKYYNQTTYVDSAELNATNRDYYMSACAFLRASQYGNGKNINTNSNITTENGDSTTDNLYGVYDLNSCFASWTKLSGGQV